MEQQNKCEECIFYKELFVIYRARFRKYCGFCSNQDIYAKHNKNKYSPKPCEKWKQKAEQIDEGNICINKVLKDIGKSLSEISNILSESKK